MKSVYALLLPLLFTACAGKKEQPVTEAEASAYAKSIQASIKAGNKNIINKVLDENLFADEVAKAAGQKSNNSFKIGVKTGLQKQNLSRQIFNSLGQDGTYEFVKQYQKDGSQHLIFRMFGEGGLNYHDFTLAKHDDSVRAKDVYIFLSGENLSKTMGGVVSAMMAADDKASLSLKEQMRMLPEIKSLYLQKRYDEAKKMFNSLPADMQKEKGFQLLNVQIASEMDEATYTQAMNEFQSLYGTDPAVQLALFDNYFLKGDYDRVLKVLDGIDKTVQDPVLDYFRSLVYSKKGDNATAVKYLETLRTKMPDFQPGALELLASYMEQKQIEKANALVASYKANKSFNQGKLATVKALYPDAADRMNW